MDPAATQVNRRILVIDDDEGTHQSFRKILGSQRQATALAALEASLFGDSSSTDSPAFQIDSAYQGEDGAAMVRRARDESLPYAMAFVDVRMPPGWDGITTVRKLWSEDDRLQAVICTAYSDHSWSDIVRKLGQTDRLLVLKKPFDVVEVRQMACAVTQKWNLQQEVNARIAELFSSEQQLEAMVDNPSTITYLKDLDGRFLLVNRNLAEILRLPREALLGKTDLDLFPPEVAEAYRAHDREVAARNTPLEFEETLRYPGGARSYLSLKFPLRDAKGAPRAVGGISIDVTHRKRAENALTLFANAGRQLGLSLEGNETARAVTQLAVGTVSSACLLFLPPDAEGHLGPTVPRFTVAHEDGLRGRLLGECLLKMPEGSPLERHLREVLATDRAEIGTLPAGALALGQSAGSPEAIALEELGRAMAITVPLSASSCSPLGTLSFFARHGTGFDQQDAELAEALGRRCAAALHNARLFMEARASVRARDDLVAAASQALQRPLVPLRLRTQYLRRAYRLGKLSSKPATLFEPTMEASERLVARLSALANDILDTSRLGEGASALRREPVDLAQLTREIVELFAPELARARCEVRLQADAPVVGRWDRLRLERLVSHLLTSALTCGGEGGPVEVTVTSDEDAARLSVRDHGHGFAIADRRRVFEPAPSRDLAAHGLNLFMAHQVVAAHGGTISIESRPGAGSTFQVVLPRGTSVNPPREWLPPSAQP